MATKTKEPKDLYLAGRRHRDEARALWKARATNADLDVWRRDKTFRDLENAAKAAPRRPARVINLSAYLPREDGLEIGRQYLADRGVETDDLGVVKGGRFADLLQRFKTKGPT
jgi:hypothetical protein